MLLVAMISGIILAGKKMDISITELSEEEVNTLIKETKKSEKKDKQWVVSE